MFAVNNNFMDVLCEIRVWMKGVNSIMAERLGMVIDMKRVRYLRFVVRWRAKWRTTPDGVWVEPHLDGWRGQSRHSGGSIPDLTMENIAVACQHLRESCVREGVPCWDNVQRSYQTGAVRQDYDKVHRLPHIACGVSVQGVRSFNWEEPEACDQPCYGAMPTVATHQSTWWRVHDITGIGWRVCSQRVEVCPGRVRFFSDFNDPESEVSRLLRERAISSFCPSAARTPPSTTSF